MGNICAKQTKIKEQSQMDNKIFDLSVFSIETIIIWLYTINLITVLTMCILFSYVDNKVALKKYNIQLRQDIEKFDCENDFFYEKTNKSYHKNGFYPPFNDKQYFMYFTIVFFFLSFALVLPFLGGEYRLICSLVYGVLTLVFFVCIFASIHIDPVHEKFKDEVKGFAWNLHLLNLNKYDEYDKNCELCKVLNLSINDYHCKDCKKCIKDYYNHYSFLNNCVGKKNFYVFLFAVLSILILSLMHCCFIMYFITKINDDDFLIKINNVCPFIAIPFLNNIIGFCIKHPI